MVQRPKPQYSLAHALAAGVGVDSNHSVATVAGSIRAECTVVGGVVVAHKTRTRAGRTCNQGLAETQNAEGGAAQSDAEEYTGIVAARTSCSHWPGCPAQRAMLSRKRVLRRVAGLGRWASWETWAQAFQGIRDRSTDWYAAVQVSLAATDLECRRRATHRRWRRMSHSVCDTSTCRLPICRVEICMPGSCSR
jgi:hypothetical protein